MSGPWTANPIESYPCNLEIMVTQKYSSDLLRLDSTGSSKVKYP